jgi:DNA-binding response OmpR family regulator
MDKILIIDDDTELCALVTEYLSGDGFLVDSVHSGDRGLARALKTEHVLVVLDVMLPGLNGLEVLRRLRATTRTPVLLLTARGEDVDRILGLELGADDYLPKPFNPRELVARIRAILRRTQTPAVAALPSLLQVGDVELDTSTRMVRQAGVAIDLTSVEFNLLEVLLRFAGQVISREKLADAALGRKFAPFDRSIDMHVSKVRKKLGDTGGAGDHIKTVRGVGYIFAGALEAERERTSEGNGVRAGKS